MYILCSCGLLFESRAKGSNHSRNPKNIKHFQQAGHKVVGKYTFLNNVPNPHAFFKHHPWEEEEVLE